MQIKKVGDQLEITLQHRTYRGTERDVFLTVGSARPGPQINLAATGDISPATARRLGRVLMVAADVADGLSPEEQA